MPGAEGAAAEARRAWCRVVWWGGVAGDPALEGDALPAPARGAPAASVCLVIDAPCPLWATHGAPITRRQSPGQLTTVVSEGGNGVVCTCCGLDLGPPPQRNDTMGDGDGDVTSGIVLGTGTAGPGNGRTLWNPGVDGVH
jgi:hypothetical protein